MTPSEYTQLKAFARVDGVVLSLLWSIAFACMVAGLSQPLYSFLAMMLIVLTPFYVGVRLKRFRDEDRGGEISLLRGWAFAILVFFYGGILLAVVQYVYMAYMDNGYLLMALKRTLDSPEGKLMVEQYGMSGNIEQSLNAIQELRPIDFALNMLTMNITAGIVLGLPIAAMMKRAKKDEQ